MVEPARNPINRQPDGDLGLLLFLAIVVGGIAGMALGYGYYGTFQQACMGFGIGMVAIPVLIFIALVFG